MQTKHNLLEATGLFFISLFLFTVGLYSQEVINFESRFYLFALEMWRYSFNWFPTTYHQPYPDYPVTSTALIYGLATLWGGLNKWVAVMPSAIAAALTVAFTYLIGALHSKRWGLAGVFFLFLTITFLKSARSIALDMYPAMVTTICFYLVYSADLKNHPHRVWWIYPLFILSFACRGPIGLVQPTGVVCIYYLLNKNFKKCFVVGLLAAILLVICTIILLLLAKHTGGAAFMQQVMRMEVLGRIEDHFLPKYFYFTNSLTTYALSFPVACFVIFGVLYYALKRQSVHHLHFLFLLMGWMLVILIGMSIPGVKKSRYLLPMVPAIALLAAFPFAMRPNEKYFVMLQMILTRFFLYIPAIFILLMEIFYYYSLEQGWDFDIQYSSIAIVLVAIQIGVLIFVYRYLAQRYIVNLIILGGAALAFVFAYINMIEPIDIEMNKAKAFVEAIEKERVTQQARLVFYKENPDGMPIKYLINMPQALPNAEQPFFINDPQSLLRFSDKAFFVTSENYFSALPKNVMSHYKIIASDAIGRVSVVVFTKK